MLRAKIAASGWVRLGAAAAALACVLAGFGAGTASAAASCQGWTGGQPPPADTRPGLGLALGATAVVSACDMWAAVDEGNDIVNGTVEHWTGVLA